jgi:hypothetical protein
VVPLQNQYSSPGQVQRLVATSDIRHFIHHFVAFSGQQTPAGIFGDDSENKV